MSDTAAKPGIGMSLIMLVVFFAITFAVAGIGGIFTSGSVETWYPNIVKPGLNPPNSVFPIVWTTLYAFMALAAWLVWRAAGSILQAPLAFLFFFTQLGLNLLWSYLFFGNCNPEAALVEILVLLALILATMFTFWRYSTLAGWLFVPYALWVSFAAWLNYRIVALNPDLIGGCF